MKTAETHTTQTHHRPQEARQGPFFREEGHDQAFFGGSQEASVAEPFFHGAIQAKLTLGQPNDRYEQEADRTADQVVQRLAQSESSPALATAVPAISPVAPSITPVQRKCATCEAELDEGHEEGASEEPLQRKPAFEGGDLPPEEGDTVQRKCAACAEKERLQAQSEAVPTPAEDMESRLAATKGGGSHLPEDTRSQMEGAMGADFSSVRVHTDSSAVQMNQELGAQAFTHGSDVYFNSGKYDADSREGQHLLAHELTHVVQQGGGKAQSFVSSRKDRSVHNRSNVTPDGYSIQMRQGSPGAVGGVINGVNVLVGSASLKQQFEQKVAAGGEKALKQWYDSFLSPESQEQVKILLALASSDQTGGSVLDKVRGVYAQYVQEIHTYRSEIQAKGISIALDILEKSETEVRSAIEQHIDTIEGIPPGGGGASGAPGSYSTYQELRNPEEAKSVARSLLSLRSVADNAMLEFFDEQRVAHPDRYMFDKKLPVVDHLQLLEEDWKVSEEKYAESCQSAVKQFPYLSMYLSHQIAANALQEFINLPEEKLGDEVLDRSNEILENIETVRAGIGTEYNPLEIQSIISMLMADEQVEGWHKTVIGNHIASVREGKSHKKLLLSALGVGMQLLAAIPTGGMSLVGTVAVHSAAALGAGLSVYNGYKSYKQYLFQEAAANTNYDKAESISKDEPQFLWVALEIVGSITGIKSASKAFKTVVNIIKASRAQKNIQKLTEIRAVVPPAAASSIMAKEAGNYSKAEVAQMIRAIGSRFREEDLSQVRLLLKKAADDAFVRAFDALRKENMIHPNNRDAITAVLSKYPSRYSGYASLAEQYISKNHVLNMGGFSCPVTGKIFIGDSSKGYFASMVVHEMVHSGQNLEKLSRYAQELGAYKAQADFIRNLSDLGLGHLVPENLGEFKEATNLFKLNELIAKNNPGIIPDLLLGSSEDILDNQAKEIMRSILRLPGKAYSRHKRSSW